MGDTSPWRQMIGLNSVIPKRGLTSGIDEHINFLAIDAHLVGNIVTMDDGGMSILGLTKNH